MEYNIRAFRTAACAVQARRSRLLSAHDRTVDSIAAQQSFKKMYDITLYHLTA